MLRGRIFLHRDRGYPLWTVFNLGICIFIIFKAPELVLCVVERWDWQALRLLWVDSHACAPPWIGGLLWCESHAFQYSYNSRWVRHPCMWEGYFSYSRILMQGSLHPVLDMVVLVWYGWPFPQLNISATGLDLVPLPCKYWYSLICWTPKKSRFDTA